jgi:RimJ/RimL family protein N-acetyltransferase
MIARHEIPPHGQQAGLAARFAGLVPEILTEQTRLRALTVADFPAWAEILCSDRSVYMDGPYSREEAYTEFTAVAGFWFLHGHGFWTVAAREGDEVLGFVGINMEPSDQEPELGFFVRAAAEGRGLAFEASAAARDWARSVNLPSLVSYIDPANTRSTALALALGAVRDPVAEAVFAGTPDAGVTVWRHKMGATA